MGIHQAKLDNLDNMALQHSLGTIRAAKTQLDLLTASRSTPSVLVSQIRFCDVLLREIGVIRSSLEDRMTCRGVIHRRAVVARRIRSSRRAATPRARKRSG
jgi:tRNA isopentenyl-2-thiomethyl-A-37 hydroxylase MiaE